MGILSNPMFSGLVWLIGVNLNCYFLGIVGINTQLRKCVISKLNTASYIAAVLMLRRLREFWFLYFAVNIVSIVMWVYLLADGNPYAVTMLVMWSAYLVNSVYGIYVWYKTTQSYSSGGVSSA